MLKDRPVKFSFIIFGVCGVFVGVLLLLSYYKTIFGAVKNFIAGKKKAPKRPEIPTGNIGDISLPNARLIVEEAEGKVKIKPEKEKRGKYPGPERREYPRLNMKAIVNYLAYSPTGIMKEEQNYTKDMGGNGVCIKTTGCISMGTILELEIKIPDYGSAIDALGCVMYSRKRMDNGFDTGVSFTDISDEERKYIINYTNSKIAR
ncbi:PilZ domain-containing protein [bacterium]|nr:PilZ domain-containing protein [bacterium]